HIDQNFVEETSILRRLYEEIVSLYKTDMNEFLKALRSFLGKHSHFQFPGYPIVVEDFYDHFLNLTDFLTNPREYIVTKFIIKDLAPLIMRYDYNFKGKITNKLHTKDITHIK